MTRLSCSLTLIIALLAGCAGPIQTRVETASSPDQNQNTSFTFAEEPKQPNEIYGPLKKELLAALKTKGFEQQTPGTFLIDFAAASRPASIAIRSGEGDQTAVIASTKGKKPLQSCIDDEHRMIVTIMHRTTGDQYYRGSASEYHCKATLEQTLPHLVKASLSDLGNAGDGETQQRILTRTGLE